MLSSFAHSTSSARSDPVGTFARLSQETALAPSSLPVADPSAGHPCIEGTSESYFGNIEFVQDVLLVVEACRRGLLPRSVRRLRDGHGDRTSAIRPGSVFVWKSNEAGMRRWTDGKSWSPSRSHGSFLLYRECLPKDQLAVIAGSTVESSADTQVSSSSAPSSASESQSHASTTLAPSVTDLGNGLQIKHGHRGDYCPLPNGLIKRTISIPVATDGATYNLVNYVHCDDVANARLPAPSTDQWLQDRGATIESLPWAVYPAIVNSITLNKGNGTKSTASGGNHQSGGSTSSSTGLSDRLDSVHLQQVRRASLSGDVNVSKSAFNPPAGLASSPLKLHPHHDAPEQLAWPSMPRDGLEYLGTSAAGHSHPRTSVAQHHMQTHAYSPSSAAYSYVPNLHSPQFPPTGPTYSWHSNMASPVPSPSVHPAPASPLMLSSSAPNLSPISLGSRPRSSTASSASSLVMREAWASVHRSSPYPSPRGSRQVSPIQSNTAPGPQLAPILAPIAPARAYPLPAIANVDQRSDFAQMDEPGTRRQAPMPVYVEPGWSVSSGMFVTAARGRAPSDGSAPAAFRPFPPPV